jgi:hypothetical protein
MVRHCNIETAIIRYMYGIPRQLNQRVLLPAPSDAS